MKPIFSREVLAHPIVISAAGVVVVVALVSGLYYVSATRQPQNVPSVNATDNTQSVTGSGTIAPAQNPDLAFVSGGRVTLLRVKVGDKVTQGQLLASLDTASLAAQRAQAAANLEAEQAKLAGMQAGPRQVDIQPKQTALSQAQLALANMYAGVPAQLTTAYDKSFSGVSADTDTLFNNPDTITPTLAFTTTNSQLGTNASNNRASLNTDLSTWGTQVNSLSTASSPGDIDTGLAISLNHLQVLRGYADSLLVALGSAVPSGTFTSTTIATDQASVAVLRDTINSLIVTLQGLQQSIASDKLAIESAQDALNQTLAGSSAQDIQAQQAAVDAAQAAVSNMDAQIANSEIIAPFSGSVSGVAIKVGQTVSAGTVGVSLNPESALQVSAYFSELDVPKIHAGMQAQVTTDAYGNSRIFPATVIAVNTSPTPGQNGAPSPGYLVTLQFAQTDPALSSGMTANVTIPLNQ